MANLTDAKAHNAALVASTKASPPYKPLPYKGEDEEKNDAAAPRKRARILS